MQSVRILFSLFDFCGITHKCCSSIDYLCVVYIDNTHINTNETQFIKKEIKRKKIRTKMVLIESNVLFYTYHLMVHLIIRVVVAFLFIFFLFSFNCFNNSSNFLFVFLFHIQWYNIQLIGFFDVNGKKRKQKK